MHATALPPMSRPARPSRSSDAPGPAGNAGMPTRNAVGLALFLTCAMAASSVSAQVLFREDFSTAPGGVCQPPSGGAGTYPFPAGWLLRNVDARPPNGSVSYVNDAWEVRDEFSFDPDNCAAFSTSWYAPEGRADDWMWTPRIDLLPGSVLLWHARTYDADFRDGYEVRVMPAQAGPPTGSTGVLGNQVTASTLVFTVDAEQTTWTPHQVRLDAFGGQGVYIGFRNNTDNRFLLLVDDVEVRVIAPDLRVVEPVQPGPWTRVPGGLAVPYVFGVRLNNAGELAAPAGAIPTATILANGSPVGAPYPAAELGTIVPGGSFNLTWNPTPEPTLPDGVVTTRYAVPVPPSDPNPANNVVETAPIVVGGNELARYLGESDSAYGIGAGNGGEIGTVLDVPVALTVVGVRLRMHRQIPPDPPGPDLWTGQPIRATLRATFADGRPIGDPLATTLAGAATIEGGIYDLPLAAPLALMPGRYLVAAVEPVYPDSMPLTMHRELFVPGTNWVTWPTNPNGTWATLESFGNAFRNTPQIGLLTDLSLFRDGFEDGPRATVASPPTRTSDTPASRHPVQRENVAEAAARGWRP
jgi:hypothetical protein